MQIVKEVGGHVSKQSYPLRGEAGWSGHSGRASKIRREQWNETSPGEQTPGHLNGGILEKRFLEVDPRGPSNFDRKVCIGPTTSFCSLLRYEPLSFLSLSSPLFLFSLSSSLSPSSSLLFPFFQRYSTRGHFPFFLCFSHSSSPCVNQLVC